MMLFGSLRRGKCWLWQKVYVKDSFSPQSPKTGQGTIIGISLNIGKQYLPHYQQSETCIKVKWDYHKLYGSDVIVWESADAYIRVNEGDSEDNDPPPGIWRTM